MGLLVVAHFATTRAPMWLVRGLAQSQSSPLTLSTLMFSRPTSALGDFWWGTITLDERAHQNGRKYRLMGGFGVSVHVGAGIPRFVKVEVQLPFFTNVLETPKRVVAGHSRINLNAATAHCTIALEHDRILNRWFIDLLFLSDDE